jgi:hypothetical protein
LFILKLKLGRGHQFAEGKFIGELLVQILQAPNLFVREGFGRNGEALNSHYNLWD